MVGCFRSSAYGVNTPIGRRPGQVLVWQWFPASVACSGQIDAHTGRDRGVRTVLDHVRDRIGAVVDAEGCGGPVIAGMPEPPEGQLAARAGGAGVPVDAAGAHPREVVVELRPLGGEDARGS